MPATDTHAEDLALMLGAADKAADIAMSFFRNDPDVWYKNEGRSPVSEADVAIDDMLQRLLLDARPDYGWLSEEVEDNDRRLACRRVFVVDPIDGTRAYVGGRKDWCVSIGLVEDGLPVAGVLAAPARGEIWQARLGGGAFLNDVRLGAAPEDDSGTLKVVLPDVVADKMRPDILTRFDKVPGGPSLALRLAMVAKGDFDGVYIRPRSNEWDLAAADVMLRETGHKLVEQTGRLMRYNEPDPSRTLLVAASSTHVAELLVPLQPVLGH
ncbi:3'(2'),5'-bisphosphate nucleotidase CysQ [Hoeflea sp.]|uniref:3'(2'),5'-bisphosphate nucleotidase CysQ n=1 Tax=Hoeflea sp. TaxID=1940281 RepID=UPI003747CCB0